MKPFALLNCVLSLVVLASCSNNEEPDFPVFMQPASIQSTDANADNQIFEYDDYGRVIAWDCVSLRPNDSGAYSAHYSYPDENTIKVTSEEVWLNQRRIFEEYIHLTNGRASKAEGTYIYSVDGNQVLRKSYRLEFGYLPTNHLNTVEHFEVMGIGDEIKANAWDNAWRWMNYLIWEDGNLKEVQDYQGSSTSWQSTKYEYLKYAVAYPIVIPMVINSAHHMPLCMQGVFGLNSVNLVKSASTFDNKANLTRSIEYSYEFEEARITKYTQITFTNSLISNPITYTVTWTE